ncbi:MAG: NAD(P)-dependent oxidoreductase [Deltaproteobacteria bacterium HGW-Deltaproteobacteria-6]|jgi:dTDP-4-dehydrorhamnose reductase|nr:MAG: NAD(P)-dependent oxidoreductase [Deltaproteobacteria bacterium HGW-Deltaproteobacteria-6]
MGYQVNKAERILITGGGGALGHKLWQRLPEKFPDTYVSIRKAKTYYENCNLFYGTNVIECLDLRDFKQLAAVLKDIRPSVIINCAGVTLRSQEADDKLSNIAVNALLPHVLAKWCAENAARLIHFSTVCVFEGKSGNYDENSPPDARDLYGMTKALGDVQSPNALTIRSSFIGREIFGGTELLEWFLAREGQRVSGYSKALFTGLTTNRLAELVSELIEKFPDLHGLYHVSSETVSKYDLLHLMKEAYKIDIEIDRDDQFECKRNLNGEKFVRATGFKCPSWRRMMLDMAADQTPYEQWQSHNKNEVLPG